jgi:hypothetical protein
MVADDSGTDPAVFDVSGVVGMENIPKAGRENDGWVFSI